MHTKVSNSTQYHFRCNQQGGHPVKIVYPASSIYISFSTVDTSDAVVYDCSTAITKNLEETSSGLDQSLKGSPVIGSHSISCRSKKPLLFKTAPTTCLYGINKHHNNSQTASYLSKYSIKSYTSWFFLQRFNRTRIAYAGGTTTVEPEVVLNI